MVKSLQNLSQPPAKTPATQARQKIAQLEVAAAGEVASKAGLSLKSHIITIDLPDTTIDSAKKGWIRGFKHHLIEMLPAFAQISWDSLGMNGDLTIMYNYVYIGFIVSACLISMKVMPFGFMYYSNLPTFI